MLFLRMWNLFWIFNINMNFLGIRKYPGFFYNFLQFFLNFSELIMIFSILPSEDFLFGTVSIKVFPFFDSFHQYISFLGCFPSKYFLFGVFRNQVFEIFQKRKSAVNVPKRKLPFHLSNFCSTFWLPRRTPKKDIFFFGNS